MSHFALRSRRVMTDGQLRPALVEVQDGRIAALHPPETAVDCPVEDLGERVLMPGIVDTHVHINEPGRTEWEGFNTATMAAAAGGITTVVDMPLNCTPVTTTAAALQEKLDAQVGGVTDQDREQEEVDRQREAIRLKEERLEELELRITPITLLPTLLQQI